MFELKYCITYVYTFNFLGIPSCCKSNHQLAKLATYILSIVHKNKSAKVAILFLLPTT